MKIIAIIPARYNSSRFIGKPLVDICGKPMIQHVYERTKRADTISQVFVATDDKRIYDAVKQFEGEVIVTSNAHETGTDRIGEAAEQIDADIIVNIQGDEPLIEPEMINAVTEPFYSKEFIQMATMYTDFKKEDNLNNPHIVKVVIDKNGFALYFSRLPIPYVRAEDGIDNISYYRQIGIYAYRKKFLSRFVSMEQTNLEKAEKLEQLRALENGIKIKMVKTNCSTVGVDIEKDLIEVKKIMAKQKKESNVL